MKTLLLLLALLTIAPSATSLGIPCADKGWYARNPWAMIFYDNRLFVGCGNSDNDGPGPNAGPVAVWTYQDNAGWVNEYSVDDEEVSRFVILDGNLIIPGRDAIGSWQFGNWYTRIDGVWEKHRNIPNAIHVFDMTEYNGLLFAGLATTDPLRLGAVGVSTDHGQTWKSLLVPSNMNVKEMNCSDPNRSTYVENPAVRMYGFFTIDGTLYGSVTPIVSRFCQSGKVQTTHVDTQYIVRWNGQDFELAQLNLFGSLPADQVVYATTYLQQTVYIAAMTVDDHQWVPLGVFTVGSDLQAKQLSIPACDRPQAIQSLDGALYVLCNQQSGASWQVSIVKTCDLATWQPISTFTMPTFARSFALTPGKLYFGLGADADASADAQAAAGEIFEADLQPATACS